MKLLVNCFEYHNQTIIMKSVCLDNQIHLTFLVALHIVMQHVLRFQWDHFSYTFSLYAASFLRSISLLTITHATVFSKTRRHHLTKGIQFFDLLVALFFCLCYCFALHCLLSNPCSFVVYYKISEMIDYVITCRKVCLRPSQFRNWLK